MRGGVALRAVHRRALVLDRAAARRHRREVVARVAAPADGGGEAARSHLDRAHREGRDRHRRARRAAHRLWEGARLLGPRHARPFWHASPLPQPAEAAAAAADEAAVRLRLARGGAAELDAAAGAERARADPAHHAVPYQLRRVQAAQVAQHRRQHHQAVVLGLGEPRRRRPRVERVPVPRVDLLGAVRLVAVGRVDPHHVSVRIRLLQHGPPGARHVADHKRRSDGTVRQQGLEHRAPDETAVSSVDERRRHDADHEARRRSGVGLHGCQKYAM